MQPCQGIDDRLLGNVRFGLEVQVAGSARRGGHLALEAAADGDRAVLARHA